MTILLLLLSALLFAFLIFGMYRARVQEEEPQSTAMALVRNPTWTPGNNPEPTPVNTSKLDLFNMQKEILINLRIMEHQLAKMEHFLILKGFDGTFKVTPKPRLTLSDGGHND